MTTDPHGWPDASKPGVPLHPERNGWHWLQFEGAPKPFPWCWLPATETDPVAAWGNGDGRELTTAGAAKRWRYLGPCLTLAERDERMREDGRREEREACAALLESMRAAHNTAMIGVWHTPDTTIAYGKAAAAIRARSKGKS